MNREYYYSILHTCIIYYIIIIIVHYYALLGQHAKLGAWPAQSFVQRQNMKL